MTDRTGGDGGRRLTKAERKEQARLEREQIQRQMAARKRNRNMGLAGLALAVVAVVVVVVIVQPGASDEPSSPQDLLAQAASAAGEAGCDAVKTIGPYNGISDPNDPNYVDRLHIGSVKGFETMPPIDTYPSIPPTSGPHAPIPPGPLPAGVYDSAPDLSRVIHSLEHGATVIWYNPSAAGPDLDQIKSFYDRSSSEVQVGQDRVIVAPYDYPGDGGQLPEGVMMALDAWHRLRTCSQLSLPVAFDFTSQYSAPTAEDRDYSGEAPEAGSAL